MGRVELLEAENARLLARIEADRAGNAGLRILVDELRAQTADLEGRLGMTSKNSSRPPSSDPNSVRAEKKLTRAERRAGAGAGAGAGSFFNAARGAGDAVRARSCRPP